MTCREKLKLEHPDCVGDRFPLGVLGCPSGYGYLKDPACGCSEMNCIACWDREIPEEKGATKLVPCELTREDKLEPSDKTIDDLIAESLSGAHIKDSGDRTEFATGAVRDMREGKGRCDLMPLDVASAVINEPIIGFISMFQADGKTEYLYNVFNYIVPRMFPDLPTMFLEVAKHFEEGAKKYGENNWQKGIPTKCYIDSAVRHYLKWLRGDKDEPHDRAFCWNILCCIWTCNHMPELNDYKKNE